MATIDNNIPETYVTFENARLLKDKGFDWIYTDDYEDGKSSFFELRSNKKVYRLSHLYYDTNQNSQQYTDLKIPCPRIALAIAWIRKNFRINIYAQFQIWDDGCFTGNWCLKDDTLWAFHDIGIRENMSWTRTKFNSPEDAENAAISYVLNNLV